MTGLVVLCGCRGEAPDRTGPWRADDHTHAAIAAMEKVLADRVPPLTATDPAPFTALGTALQDEIDALIRGCTMTGPDHDQLHVWLDELLPLVRTLREEGSLDARRAALGSLRQHLGRFHEWFPDRAEQGR